MRFRVQLDTFAGPLDLLLYLVRKHELDVLDIPIARVADQYLEILAVLEQIDVDAVGDFLELATRLMEIKSRMMLPRQEEVEEQPDRGSAAGPRRRGCWSTSGTRTRRRMLEERDREWQLRFARRGERPGRRPARPGRPADPGGRAVGPGERIQPRDAREGGAASRRGSATTTRRSKSYMQRIADRLAAEPRLAFADLFPAEGTQGRSWWACSSRCWS